MVYTSQFRCWCPLVYDCFYFVGIFSSPVPTVLLGNSSSFFRKQFSTCHSLFNSVSSSEYLLLSLPLLWSGFPGRQRKCHELCAWISFNSFICFKLLLSLCWTKHFFLKGNGRLFLLEPSLI